jgi:hypothetical protein
MAMILGEFRLQEFKATGALSRLTRDGEVVDTIYRGGHGLLDQTKGDFAIDGKTCKVIFPKGDWSSVVNSEIKFEWL